MQLELEGVSYTYGPGTAYEVNALDGIDLKIGQGEFIGVIGHTGSGKSTLIEHLNGLIKPTEGRVLCDGEDIWGEGYDIRSLRTKVGLVFQYPENQLFEETVLKDVMFGPGNKGLDEPRARERALDALVQVGMDEKYYDMSPFELSGGQKRRAAIAGVLAMDPEVLILDEPTAGLDPGGRDEILEQIKKLRDERGITVILVSHSMEDVAKYASRIIVVHEGRIAFDDVPGNVFASYEKLEEMGLAAPQISYVLHALKEKGYDVDTTATTVEMARDTIMAAIAKRRAGRTADA